MTMPLDRAFDAIEDLAVSILPDADVQRVGTEDLAIENGGKRAVARLTRALLEDFESTLDGGLPVRYSNGIKNEIRSRIYLALGAEDMIPEERISEILLTNLTICFNWSG
jgi:hypothetical protein